MASYICTTCKELLGVLHGDFDVRPSLMEDNNHIGATIAKGNIIETVEAKE